MIGKTGSLARGDKIHLAIKARTTGDHRGRPYQLWSPAYCRITNRNITWLLPAGIAGTAVTCKKCQALAALRGISEFTTLTHADSVGESAAADDAAELSK